MSRFAEIRKLLETRQPGTDLEIITNEEIQQLSVTHPGIPSDLIELYAEIGYGGIGNSAYMIHFPMGPEFIYGDPPPPNLERKVIVGDDFAGHCEAYDTKEDWTFGTILPGGKFEPDPDCKSFVDFLCEWIGNPENESRKSQ